MARIKIQQRSRKPATHRVSRRKDPPGMVFLPDREELARVAAMRGASDAEIAHVFGVDAATFAKWRDAYPSFNAALEDGRLKCDTDVVVSLYQRATGYSYEEDVAVGGKEPTVLTVRRHAPPDVSAQQYWLNNRQPKWWGSKTRTEHTGKDGGPIGVKHETRHDLIDAIVSLVQPKNDPPPPSRAHPGACGSST